MSVRPYYTINLSISDLYGNAGGGAMTALTEGEKSADKTQLQCLYTTDNNT